MTVVEVKEKRGIGAVIGRGGESVRNCGGVLLAASDIWMGECEG